MPIRDLEHDFELRLVVVMCFSPSIFSGGGLEQANGWASFKDWLGS